MTSLPTVMIRIPSGLLILLLVMTTPAFAVDCVPSDITLSSQAEVESFQADYGPCDRVDGKLSISGADITNLDTLSGLTDIFWLEIISNPLLDDLLGLSSVSELAVIDLLFNPSLTSVDGLSGDSTPGSILLLNNWFLSDIDAFSGVTSISNSLILQGTALTNIDAFSSLTAVGGSVINIIDNSQLQSISGLAGVTGFSGTYYVRNNPQLASLNGIGGEPGLTGLVIWNNDALTHVDQLSGLETVSNQYSELVVRDNENLHNVDGLSDLVGVNAGLEVRDNPKLDDCSALRTLLDDVDDAAPGPGPGSAGIPDLNGDVRLEGNLPGCNLLEEILRPARYHYGGLVKDADQLLFRGVSVTRSCFSNPIQLPDLRRLPAPRVLSVCGLIAYTDDDLLVYDVARDECRVLEDFLTSTVLQVEGIYQELGNLGAPLRERAETTLENDRFALLYFNAANGSLFPGEPSACLDNMDVKVIFVDSFE